MTGELWRSAFSFGKELSYGGKAAATRRMYFRPADSRFTKERAPRVHRFATTTRDNVRALTLGPNVVGGPLVLPLSASELVELLLMTIQGDAAPAEIEAGVAYKWTFAPNANALQSATVEWNDGARAWVATGVLGNSLRIAGNVREETIVTVDTFGQDLELQAMTGGLNHGVPDFIEGWETKLFVDAFGGVPGTTPVTDALLSWDVLISNNLGRKYYANNTKDLGDISVGELQVEATFLLEGKATATASALSDWNAATYKMIRLDFGNNATLGAGANKKFVTVDLPGAWSAIDLGGTDEGTRVYELRYQYIYDPAAGNAFGVEIAAQNGRNGAAAWANR
ncbi:MAG: hypothetical protein ACYC4L_04635 [Chloroflexota bacterium]